MRLALVALVAIAGCKDAKKKPARDAAPRIADAAPDAAVAVELPPVPPVPRPHRGLPRVQPAARPPTAERVELGRELFETSEVFGDMTCASCHLPERGYASPVALDKTSRGATNLRNAPSLFDLAYHDAFYRDARADNLAALLPGHIRGQLGADVAEVAVRLAEDVSWRAHFERAFSSVPRPDDLVAALVDFLRTRFSPPTAWDRHEAGERDVVSASAIRGAAVFNERAGCAVCHPPPLYTDRRAHPTAVPAGVGPPDPGRARITEDPGDRRAFKTPSLRGLTLTAPYFHAGTTATLAEALDVELGRADPGLTGSERADLLAFLRALSP